MWPRQDTDKISLHSSTLLSLTSPSPSSFIPHSHLPAPPQPPPSSMVSTPLYSPSPTVFPLSFRKLSSSSFPPSTPPFSSPRRRLPQRALTLTPFAVGTSPNLNPPGGFQSQNNQQQQQQQQQKQVRTLFPGGFKRAEIKVPTFVLSVTAEEVLGSEGSRAAIDATVAKGAVGIVLLSGAGGGGGGGGSSSKGGVLYEAACVLKALIRDRAYLMIDERVDIAAAIGANGVLLSDQGLPAIVARNMMSKSTTESVLLPLVARNIASVDDALSASSSEGADFLIIGTKLDIVSENLENFVFIEDTKIPLFFRVSGIEENLLLHIASELLGAGASGLVLSMYDLELLGDDMFQKLYTILHGIDKQMLRNQRQSNMAIFDVGNGLYDKKLVAGFTKLVDVEIRLIEEERRTLVEAVTVMRKAVPLMNEISLLVDAIAWLDQPFLLAVVGEFNSGKSSVINALLGRRCLREGVIPTTNEVTFLCYSDTEVEERERCERHPDGQLICYLPAPILGEMNIVDTPGTNVILQRQQSLTEEFIPRADLVLFVMSSDRPLTESEVAFLNYIQQWKKKVLFLLNKSDLYSTDSELEEALSFIKENVRQLLNTKDVILFPVSARSALEAKLSTFFRTGQSSHMHLTNDPRWKSSGFLELENFLFSFLDGSTSTGMERMRLKLETPIAIADRLLAGSEKLLQQEYEQACEDLIAVNNIVASVRQFALRLENECVSWRRQALSLVQAAKARTVKLAKSILQLSNVDLIITYALRVEKSSSVSNTASIQEEIIKPALSDTQALLEEYQLWLQSSASQERQTYVESFRDRWPGLVNDINQAHKDIDAFIDKQVNLSLQVTQNFSAIAASRLFDQEIREVALRTYGGLGAAGLSASLLTSVLPTTLEDLLALALCSAGGFFAVSNFPVRRKSVIEKVERVADGLAQHIEQAMQKDLSITVENLKKFVESYAEPYKEAAQRKIERLTELQKEIALAEQKIQVVKTGIQNLHS